MPSKFEAKKWNFPKKKITSHYKHLKNMKKFLLISFFLVAMGACTQKLCPTYSQLDAINGEHTNVATKA
ncbi:MAG: hypothetical protein CMB82_06175 [Flammeovirgaceae bacterium]|nr:hypothetical protein [Flammeovirgaceae bacterium]